MSLVSGVHRDKNFLFEWQMILLVEWQFPRYGAFILRRFVNFWEIVQYVFRVEVSDE